MDTISKIRGIDVLKVNNKLKELEKTVAILAVEKNVLHLQLANLEAASLAEKYLRNLNFIDIPQDIQALTNELIKQINIKNLKLTQEDYNQYLLFRNSQGSPVCLIGDFSPDRLIILVSSTKIKNPKDYQINFNSWHGIVIGEMGKNVKKLLEFLR